uniref:Uncharacterized protein n=1 Tax=Lutzomyia longipalpis TaxID=7200 RepID=A0A1B0CH55_LUTLO
MKNLFERLIKHPAVGNSRQSYSCTPTMRILFVILAILMAACAARHHHRGHQVHIQASHEHENHANANNHHVDHHSEGSNWWYNVPHYDYYGREHLSKP